VNALAYTVDEHVVFGADAYDPASMEGRRLLAMNSHMFFSKAAGIQRCQVVLLIRRQTKGRASRQPRLQNRRPDDQFEREADRIADRIMK